MIYKTVTVDARLSENIVTVGAMLCDSIVKIAPELTTTIKTSSFDEYSGPYEFTPTQETQTVPTAQRVLLENIIINPIPSNYGLITWNGSVLTVS